MSKPIEITLCKPVYDKSGKPVETLHLRRPTGAEILECGFPFTQKRNPRNREVTETVDMAAVYPMIGACAGISANAAMALEPADLYECVETLRLFFLYKIREPSSDTTSNRENGAATADLSSA